MLIVLTDENISFILIFCDVQVIPLWVYVHLLLQVGDREWSFNVNHFSFSCLSDGPAKIILQTLFFICVSQPTSPVQSQQIIQKRNSLTESVTVDFYFSESLLDTWRA